MIRSEISQARNSISYYLARFRVSILFDAFRVIFLILILFAHTHGCTSIRAQAQAHARTRLSSRLSNCPQSCCTADAADVVLVVCASEERRASTTKRVPHDSSALAPQTPPRQAGTARLPAAANVSEDEPKREGTSSAPMRRALAISWRRTACA